MAVAQGRKCHFVLRLVRNKDTRQNTRKFPQGGAFARLALAGKWLTLREGSSSRICCREVRAKQAMMFSRWPSRDINFIAPAHKLEDRGLK